MAAPFFSMVKGIDSRGGPIPKASLSAGSLDRFVTRQPRSGSYGLNSSHLPADNAKAGVFHGCGTGLGTWIRRLVGASAHLLAAALFVDGPFGDIAVQVEEERLALLAGPREAARLFEKRRAAAELLDL